MKAILTGTFIKAKQDMEGGYYAQIAMEDGSLLTIGLETNDLADPLPIIKAAMEVFIRQQSRKEYAVPIPVGTTITVEVDTGDYEPEEPHIKKEEAK